MRDWFNRLFYGRQGMDEFSKALFWMGLLGLLLSGLCSQFLAGIPSLLLSWLGLMMLITCFVRAFSRKLQKREAENNAYLSLIAKKTQDWQSAKERRSQKEYKFFKCPGCGTMLRVPRGKGKIHIKCRCGYTLYRKT